MNLANIQIKDILSWDNDQLCASLVEAKNIEKLVNFMKETLRERVESGTTIEVSNGNVNIGSGYMMLSHDVTTIDERFLLNPIRPLNKTLVKAHMIESGAPPTGVTVKWSKKSVRITPN